MVGWMRGMGFACVGRRGLLVEAGGGLWRPTQAELGWGTRHPAAGGIARMGDGSTAKVRGVDEGGIGEFGSRADSRRVPGTFHPAGGRLPGGGTWGSEVWPTRLKMSLPFRLGNTQSCRGHNKRRSRHAICRGLCVCCSCGCPSHRHLAGTCVGESQWQGAADDGHVRAEPDRIDCVLRL